jgi:hypothetical protein
MKRLELTDVRPGDKRLISCAGEDNGPDGVIPIDFL